MFPGCGYLDPPSQPLEAKSELNLEQCLICPLLWPKALIHLGPPITTPKPTPVNGSAPSQEKATPPAEPVKEDMNADDEPIDYLNFLDDVSPLDQPDRDLMVNSPVPTVPEKYNCTKRLFCSQPTPEAQPSDDLSQGTLNDVLKQTISKQPRKAVSKKRKQHALDESMSQPVPGSKLKSRRVQDRITIPDWHATHVMAKPILPPKWSCCLSEDMKILHESVLHSEAKLLRESRNVYPLYIAKVPKLMGFLHETPGDMLFVRFDDIFDMYHMKALHRSMVRLFVLSMARQLINDKNPDIMIIDPYYMSDCFVNTTPGRIRVTKFIEDIFVANSTKNIFLMPYFPK